MGQSFQEIKMRRVIAKRFLPSRIGAHRCASTTTTEQSGGQENKTRFPIPGVLFMGVFMGCVGATQVYANMKPELSEADRVEIAKAEVFLYQERKAEAAKVEAELKKQKTEEARKMESAKVEKAVVAKDGGSKGCPWKMAGNWAFPGAKKLCPVAGGE